MSDLGTKHECSSCGTKFYDLGQAEPICPKCGLNQLAEEEEPVEEPEAEEAEEKAAADKSSKAKAKGKGKGKGKGK